MRWISNFLAKAVLGGFVFAVGFGLIVDQLPKILGIPKPLVRTGTCSWAW